jgi:hypothetical protein
LLQCLQHICEVDALRTQSHKRLAHQRNRFGFIKKQLTHHHSNTRVALQLIQADFIMNTEHHCDYFVS